MRPTLLLRASFLATIAAPMIGCEAEPMEALGLLPGTLQQSMVAHYRFDETEGAVLHDSSGNNRHGAIVGGTWDVGRFGGALTFRRGDHVSVEGFPDATSSWSISVWVRVPQAELGYGSATVLSTENALVGGWEINLNDIPGELHYHFGYFTGPGQYEYAYHDCYCVPPDTWRMITAVVDSASMTMSFYVDGTLQHRGAISRPILPGERTLYIGRWQLTERLFAGSVDDVVIYARALLSEEVLALYNGAAPDP